MTHGDIQPGKLAFLGKIWDPNLIPPMALPFLVMAFGLPVWVPAIVVAGFLVGRILDRTRDDGPKLAQGIKEHAWEGSWEWIITWVYAIFRKIFGQRHGSLRCVAASVTMTITSLIIFGLAYAVSVGDPFDISDGKSWSARLVIFSSWVAIALVVDFANLFKIRVLFDVLTARAAGLFFLTIALALVDLVTCFFLFFAIAALATLTPLILWWTFGTPDLSQSLVNLKANYGIDFIDPSFPVFLKSLWFYLRDTLDLRTPFVNFKISNPGAPFLYSLLLPSAWILTLVLALLATRMRVIANWYLRFLAGFTRLESAPYTSVGTNFGILFAAGSYVWWRLAA